MASATFHYRAVGADGKLRTGIITAESTNSVARELLRQGLTPVYVGSEQKKSMQISLPSFGGGRRRDVLFFTQELSTLLNSGVPLDRALSITTELTTKPHFKTVVSDILRSIKGGKSLADALAIHPTYFSDLFINMVRAGEASGSLGQIFDRLSRIRTIARRTPQLHHFVDDLSRAAGLRRRGVHLRPARLRRSALRQRLR